MTQPPRRQLGTNFHLDVFRPWLSGDRLERNVAALADQGLRHVRLVGEPLQPSPDGMHASDPQGTFSRIVTLCTAHRLEALTLCWNVVSDVAAGAHPLIDASGNSYTRGHWGLFNFADPKLRENSLRSLSSIAGRLSEYPAIFKDFQPTNEWLLTAYPPHGWSWPAYAGEMIRLPGTQVMYDPHTMARWTAFLAELPTPWRAAIRRELANDDLTVAQAPDLDRAGFSAHALAWARFRATLMGDYLVEVYEHVKAGAPHLRLLSQSAMPTPLTTSGLREASLGHNPEYWLQCGTCCDTLAVNVYDSYLERSVYPGHRDRALDHPAWLMYFRELTRAYAIPQLAVSEQGANSYTHSDETQRYLVMRGALSAASFDLDLHTHLLLNDEPGFEAVHEQFFGILRDQHQQPKPAAHELQRVHWVLQNADPEQHRVDPQVLVIIPRESMDVGLEAWTPDTLTGDWQQVTAISSDSLYADRGGPERLRVIVLAGEHRVSSSRLLERLASAAATVVLPLSTASFGVDDDDRRQRAWSELTGLSGRTGETTFDDLVATWRTPAGAIDRLGRRTASAVLVEDLPGASEVLCTTSDQRHVLAYRYNDRVVSALPIGRPEERLDPELTHWTTTLLETTIRPRCDLPVRVIDGRDLTYHLIGDILCVVNPRSEPRQAVVAFDDDRHRITLPVAPGRFSAIQLAADPRAVLVSAPGEVSIDQRTLITNNTSAAILTNSTGTTVIPLHDTSGELVTGVRVNGAAAGLTTDGQDVWRSPVRMPLTVDSTSRPVVTTTAEFRREIELSGRQLATIPDSATIHHHGAAGLAHTHSLFVGPDQGRIEWHGDQPLRTRVRYRWWSGVSQAHDAIELDLDTASGLIAAPLPDEYPALVECTLMAEVPTSTNVKIVYEATRPLPSQILHIGPATLRCRLVHPLELDRYDILTARATWLEPTQHQVNLVVGHRGMHTRHVQWSEDWFDVAEPSHDR